MKRLVSAVLAAGLVFGGSSSALAAENCTSSVTDRLLPVPVEVCVSVPGLPNVVDPLVDQLPLPLPLPDIPSLPVLPEPAVPVVPPVAPQNPAAPAPAPAAPPVSPVSPQPVVPVDLPRDVRPTPDLTPIPAVDRSPKNYIIDRIFEKKLTFPFVVFLVLLAILFGGSRVFSFFMDLRSKPLDKRSKGV